MKKRWIPKDKELFNAVPKKKKTKASGLTEEKRKKLRKKRKKKKKRVRVYTKAFRTEQSFGPASECIHLLPEDIVEMYGDYGQV